MGKDRNSQADRARDALRAMILQGRYGPGQRLSEPALSDELGISRTPVREAIGSLVEDGLLERVETGGCRVSRFTMQDVVDAIEVRGTMEGLAARLAAERGVDRRRAGRCRDILARIDAALAAPGVDFDTYVDQNAAFHDWIATAAGSALITRELARATRLPLSGPSAFLAGQEAVPHFLSSLTIAQAQHRAIFDAIEAGESSRAEAIAREHARLARRNLQDALAEKETMARRIPGLSLIED
ncbi:GntR family transcriptional regulator [Rhodobacterales bacterium HKCCE3408]|nr:GntR family transcriptional regulator [Rhodobacterales bacterium HKCCE3408]